MNDQAEVEVEERATKDQLPAPKLGSGLAIQHANGAVGIPMPRDVRELVEFSQLMSRAGPMVGKAFQDNPGACMGITLQSMRWGLDPYACSQKAYQASKSDRNAPIAYESQLIHAVIIKNAPLAKRLRCTYEGEGPDRKVTIVGYLEGDDEPFEYTSPPVEKIDKDGKGSPLWKDDPDQQLWYFGVRSWARKWVPEVIMGVYAPEELATLPEAASGGGTVTLMGESVSQDPDDPDRAVEAEFTDVGANLARNATGKGAPKKARPATARSDDGPSANQQEASTAGEGEADKGEDATAAADADSDVESGEGAEDETDDLEILESITAKKTAKAKRTAFDYHRGAVNRIAETGGPKSSAIAKALLEEFASAS